MLLAQSVVPSTQQEKPYPYKYQGNNEAKELVQLLFSGYKYLISSQDERDCNFYPSCSVYAVESLQKKGLAVGFLNTFDRLTRCHPLSRTNYKINPKNGLAIDPVQ
jgi:putative membrane protein insertion efficiency factor